MDGCHVGMSPFANVYIYICMYIYIYKYKKKVRIKRVKN